MWRFFLILSISLSVTYASEDSVNPCDILTEEYHNFAPNPRGCEWFFYCGDRNNPIQGRCRGEKPEEIYHFNFNSGNSSCEVPENVECTIDDELWNTTCPGIGIAKVPHPYSCSEYSGKKKFNYHENEGLLGKVQCRKIQILHKII